MTLGQKIKKLRTDKGITQKDLADKLHVTFQTVSKWEKDENEPDVSTIKELSKIFECSIDNLLSEEELQSSDNKEAATEEKEQKVVYIHEHPLHVCERCHKPIEDDDLEATQVCTRHASRGHSAEYREAFYHKECLSELRNERAIAAKKAADENKRKALKKVFGWSISAGVISLVISLISLLNNPECSIVGAIGYSILISYFLFSMIYCILSGSYIGEVFVWCAGLSVKFPGIIFSWDLNGFVFLIAMKVLFAVLGFIIGVIALLLAIIISGLLGGISFPFVLIHNIKTNYEDAL